MLQSNHIEKRSESPEGELALWLSSDLYLSEYRAAWSQNAQVYKQRKKRLMNAEAFKINTSKNQASRAVPLSGERNASHTETYEKDWEWK